MNITFLIKIFAEINKEEFLYYLLGRYIETLKIKNILENSSSPKEKLKNKIQKLNGSINNEQLEFIENFNSYYNELIRLWNSFYEEFFKHKDLN
ncbi:hypothetical protein [Bacillus stercoris]|uniref:Uncharacterized protein n=1 Tax=Bacillus stercoris TaxID=2054641 RepID=A0ABU0VAP4_9BACI|nr:hypothetical protein [Bacillus stercoris]KFF55621.1 hypothetical protein CM50_03545 [Bacillus subtilis] [Bacillus stercoris]MDQ1854000.1 hypothetical protein [Bacillus stercoris]